MSKAIVENLRFITGYSIRKRWWCFTERACPVELKVYHTVKAQASINVLYPGIFEHTTATASTCLRFRDMDSAVSALNDIHHTNSKESG